MPPIPSRVIIYPADISLIMGISIRASQTKLVKIRKSLNKPTGAPVSIFEFAKYMNMDIEVVKTFMK